MAICTFFAAFIAATATCVFTGSPAPPKQLASFLHDGEVHSLAFSPDGHYIVAGSAGTELGSEKFYHGRIKVWDVRSLKAISSFDVSQHIASLAFSPNGTMLAVGCGNVIGRGDIPYTPQQAEVRILSFPQLKEEKRFHVGDRVRQVLFSRTGDFISASFSTADPTYLRGDVSIWCIRNWERVRHIKNSRESRIPVARSTDGSSFFMLARPPDGDGLYRITELRPELKEQEDNRVVTFDTANNPSLIESIAAYSDKRHFIYHSGGPIRIINTENGMDETPEALITATSPYRCRGFTVSEDGNWLACWVGRRGSHPLGHDWVLLWDLVKQKQIAAWPWPEERVYLKSIALSPDKKLLAVGNGKGRFSQGKQQAGEVVLYDLTKLLDR